MNLNFTMSFSRVLLCRFQKFCYVIFKKYILVKFDNNRNMNTLDIIKNLYKLKENMPDLIIKKINIGLFKHVYVVSNESVSSGDRINDFILKYFSNKSIIGNKVLENLKKDINEYIPSINFKCVTDEKKLYELLFSGFTLVIYKNTCIAYETRAELDRGVTEPTSEPVIRGPKDSFTENYQKNLGLIRKRVKSEHLLIKELTLGVQGKSKVGLLYMDNICEDELINEVYSKLKNINVDGVMDVNYLKYYIDCSNKTLFPTLMYTEKPDDASRYLLEGRVIVTMENSPSVIVCPTFFVDFFQNSEDYYHKPFFSTFMRVIRLLAFILAIVTPAFFIAITSYDPEILPVNLLINFSMQRSNVPFPIIIEAFILLFTFELLYEGDARTPNNRGASLSILGALVLGDAAVSAGLISPIMVIVVAISSISSLIFIYYDMQGSIRFWRYFLMFISGLFGIIGFIMGILLLVINLCSIKTFNKPYTVPIFPFMFSEQGNAILRKDIKSLNKRPSYVTKKNIFRKG